MPILSVGDVRQAADWYVSRLGFSLAGTWGDGDSATFAIVGLGDVTLGLTKSDRAGSGEDWAAYVYVDDIATFADHALGHGATVDRGPEDSFYGCREVEVTDPAGNRICFAQDLRPGRDGPGL